MISCYCRVNVVQFEVQFIAIRLEQFSISFCSRLVKNLKNRICNLYFAPVFPIAQIENFKSTKIRKINFAFQLQKNSLCW